jgi:hypothetical protein
MSAPGQASGTSLLLIFSAIDLSCSAMVCGVLLTVVLIGGSGSSVVASEGEGGATGVTIVEAWLPKEAQLSLDGVQPDETPVQSSSEIIRAIVPTAVRRQVYMLPPGINVLRLHATGTMAAVVHAGTGESLLIAISCQQDPTDLTLYVAPKIRLPNCVADTGVGSRKMPLCVPKT